MSGDKISVTVSGGASDPVARARRYAAASQIGPRGLIVDLADAVELARGERDALERQVVADSAWRASLEQELKTARDELIEERANHADAATAAWNERCATLVVLAHRERDAALDALDEANQALADERNQQSAAPLDPGSPADLRRAADLLEALDVDWRPPGGDGWTPSNLRARATRVGADAAEDALVEKVAQAIHASDLVEWPWDDLGERHRVVYRARARAAIAVMREAGQ